MTDQSSSSSATPDPRVRRAVIVTLLFGLAGLAWLTWWFVAGRYVVTTNDAYVTGNMIPVDDQTPGTIRRVLVRTTEHVGSGQPLAILQGDRARLRLQHAQAQLASTVRGVRRAFAEVARLKAQLMARRTELRRRRADLRRFERALPSGAVTAIRAQDAALAVRAATARVAATRAALRAASAAVRGTTLLSNPLVRRAASRLELADILWQRRIIRAPVSGYVAERYAYPNAIVHPGERLFTIVPLDDLWVVANVKETRMADVRPGQRVQLTSDYYGDTVRYEGRVLGLLPGAGGVFSILPPENATGNYIHIVERVPVRIALSERALERHPLRPGLSMNIRIDLRTRGRSVLTPLTRTPVHDDRTAILTGQRTKAQALAAAIIAANSGQTTAASLKQQSVQETP